MRNLLTGLMATTLAATFVAATANSAPLYVPQSEPAGVMQKVGSTVRTGGTTAIGAGTTAGIWAGRNDTGDATMTITATATAARSVVIITGTTGGTMTGTTTTV